MASFQSAVNIFQAFGVVGEILLAGPTRAAPAILDSDAVPQKIGNAFTWVSGANAGNNSNQNVAGVAKVGGTGVFAGILVNPKVYAAQGTVAGGTLAPTLVVPDQTIGELLFMGEIVVSLPGPANQGDLVVYDPLTGDLNSIPPTTLFTGSIAAGGASTNDVLTVSAITAGRLAIGSVIAGTGIPVGTSIVSLGTGLGGTGTYNISTINLLTVGSEAMTAVNMPEPPFSGTGSLATDGLLTVASVVSGQVSIGSRIIGAGIDATVTSFGTGVGGTGTYHTNQTGSVVTTEAITSAGNTLVPHAVVDRWTISDTGGLAVIKLTN